MSFQTPRPPTLTTSIHAARNYAHFWTQSGQRMVGFSDTPFVLPPDAPSYYGTFEAKHMTRYLEDYVDSHIYRDVPLRDRIRFGNRVTGVAKSPITGAWEVTAEELSKGNVTDTERTENFKALKLVVATGLTSLPRMPRLPDRERFKGPIVHHRDFGHFSRTKLLSSQEVKRVLVLGSGKSATDMAYACAKRQNTAVHWVIPQNGNGAGPGLFFPAAGDGKRYENSTESSATRMGALWSPSSFMPATWWSYWPRWLVHQTSWGIRRLAAKVEGTDAVCRDAARYRSREGALPGFEGLDNCAS